MAPGRAGAGDPTDAGIALIRLPAADDEINLAAVLSPAEERTRARGIRQVRAGGGLGEAAERIFFEQRQPSSNRRRRSAGSWDAWRFS